MKGSTGFAPTKALDEEGLAEGGQRFRFIPLHKRLANASARPVALPSVDYNLNLQNVSPDDTNFSHFSATLASHRDDNPTASFITYISTVQPLSLSLPLLYRNRVKVVNASLEALEVSSYHSGESTAAITSCIAALAKDLGSANFYPFFPSLCGSIALALNPQKYPNSIGDNDEIKDEETKNQLDISTFWQPEVMLIPLFSMLSEITKILVFQLAAHPSNTVSNLRPLLSHHHYRVREMTAEASLGYIIRKTRDSKARHALIINLVSAANRTLASSTIQTSYDDSKRFADGLGVSLFESIRLPSGRLHSRAKDSLQLALSQLVYDSERKSERSETSKIKDDFRLEVLSRCFANLCRQVTAENDVQMMGILLTSDCDKAVTKEDWSKLANIFFLMRKWMQFGGHNLVKLLGMPFCQRALNLCVQVIDKSANHTRLSCEVFACIGTIYQFTSQIFREKSATRGLSSALNKISKSSHPQTLLAVLQLILDNVTFGLSSSAFSTLAKGVSNVCNQAITLYSQSSKVDIRQSGSKHVLNAALKFFKLASQVFDNADISTKFNAPALQALVLDILTSSASFTDLSISGINPLAQALEFISVVPISNCVDKLESLLENRDSFSLNDCANYLIASAYQRQAEESASSQWDRMAHCASTILRERLFISKEAWAIPRVCTSVVRSVQAFGYDILLPKESAKSETGKVVLSIPQLTELASMNLSSDNSKLKLGTVPLLYVLDRSSSLGSIADLQSTEEDVQIYVQGLRHALMNSEPNLGGACRAFMYIMHVSRSLGGINSRLILLQEMSRIVKQVQHIPTVMINTLTHFTLGLFFMSLKPLWQSAGALLNALAGHNSQFVFSLALKSLKFCEKSLLSDYSKTFDEENEDIDTDEDDDGSDDDQNGEMKTTNIKLDKEDNAHDQKREVDGEFSNLKPGSRKRKRSSASMAVSKRQKQKAMESARLHWNTLEWKSHLVLEGSFLSGSSSSTTNSSTGLREESTDRLTVVTEIVRALSKEPKHTIKFRSDIIDLYLNLAPGLFPRLKGNALALSFTLLLEKMGGLKCAEANVSLDRRLRERLMGDISRNAPALQSAAVQCLCVSRSGSLKKHRDSFLRLIDDKTFREEMAIITEEKFNDWNMSEETRLSDGDEAIVDVLLRICFSKMIGKKSSAYSRKSAVMSFVTSKLPWRISLPKMTDLILAPLQASVEALETNCADDFIPPFSLPVSHIQQGVLTSMETAIKHCRHTLPAPCWKKIALAGLLLLQKSGSGTLGQKVRSKILRILAQMFHIRPKETSFVTMRILSAMESKASGKSGGSSINGAPALLRLMAVMFKNSTTEEVDVIFERHTWVFYYCSRVVQSPECNGNSVELVCEMLGSQLLSHMKDRSNGLTSSREKEYGNVLRGVAGALCKLFSRLMSLMDAERNAQKQWSTAFSKSLKIVEQMVDIDQSLSISLLDLADELGAFLRSPLLLNVALRATLRTLSTILCAASTNEASAKGRRGVSVSQLLPLISNRRFTQDNESFIALCDLITTVGSDDLQKVVNLLRDLNAMSTSRLEEADLDMRINALNSVTSLFKNGLGGRDDGPTEESSPILLEDTVLSADSIIAICHGCISAINVNDTAIRGSSGYALRLIARWTAFHDSEVGRSARPVILEILYGSLISAKLLKHRRELCGAFGEMIRSLEGELSSSNHDLESSLAHFRGLSNAGDLEMDFFENVVHLQAHRRSRALRQMEKHLNHVKISVDEADSSLKTSVVSFSTSFVLPFSLQIALERPDMDEQKRRKNPGHHMSREEAQKDVSLWAVNLAGLASSIIEWGDYKRCVDHLLRKVTSKSEDENTSIIYKLLVRVAESFPKASESRYLSDTIATTYLIEVLFPKMLRLVNVGSMNDLLHHDEKSGSMFVQAGNKNDKSQNTFRAPVAIALGKLMTHLPEDNLETMMPLLVTPLIAALRSRMISTRDAAKKALTGVTLSLGPKYLYFILQQVLSSLSEGFRKEMSIYVIQALLQGIKEFRAEKSNLADDNSNSFAMDGCVDLVVEQIIEELKGGASETRKDFEDPNASDTRVKQATARAFKAFECAELLGELIVFTESAQLLCTLLLDVYIRSISGKLISRVDQLMQRLLLGLTRNTSMKVEDALKLCFELVCTKEDEDENDANNSRNKLKSNEGSRSQEREERNSNTAARKRKRPKLKTDQWKAVNFGLQLLNSVLAKNGVLINDRKNERAPRLFSMCQPFLPLSVAALKSGQDDVTLTCLRLLQKLLKMPIPGKGGSVGKDITIVIINILSQHSGGISGDGEYEATNDLFNTCLRAAGVLLKEVDNDDFSTVSKSRVDGLLSVACRCLESGSTECQSSAISLIRAVVNRKVVLPCVYDSIETVNRLSIHCAQSSRLRDACLSVSISFLCTFPMAPRRVRQHIEFFVRNINYELASGRIAALLAIRQIIEKFPAKLLSRDADYLFVTVAANVARDEDSECREAAFSCLQLLFSRLASTRKAVDLVRTAYTLAGVHDDSNQAISNSDQTKEELEDDSDESKVVNDYGEDEDDTTEKEMEIEPVKTRWRCDSITDEHDIIVRRCGIMSLYAACKSGKLNKRQTHIILEVIVTLFEHFEKTKKLNNGSNDDNESSSDSWETVYVTLQVAEAVFASSHGSFFLTDGTARSLWEGMKKCLVHRHQWVRLLAARLIGSHLSACGGREVKQKDLGVIENERGVDRTTDDQRGNSKWTVWSNNSIVRDWIKASCVQLEADHLSNDLGKQCLKNLLCMAHVAYNYPTVGDIGQQKHVRPDDELKTMVKAMGMGEDQQSNEHSDNAKEIGRMLRWVVTRMCGIAAKGGQEEHHMLRRGCALRFMLVSVKWWGSEIISQFLRLYVFPVVRVLESGQTEQDVRDAFSRGYNNKNRFKHRHSNFHRKFSSSNNHRQRRYDDNDDGDDGDTGKNNDTNAINVDAIRMIVESLQTALIDCVGNEEYYKMYHDLRSKVNTSKLERKRRAAVMLAVDGERAARRRRMKSAKRRGKTLHEKDIMKDVDVDVAEDGIEQERQMKRTLTDGL